MHYGFGLIDTLFPIMFIAVFVLIVGTAIHGISQNVARNSRDNASPQLSVEAAVVAKRSDTRHGSNRVGRTYYFATFEVESGDRLEFDMDGHDYGMLVEGDRGMLSFQGSRYLGFERRR